MELAVVTGLSVGARHRGGARGGRGGTAEQRQRSRARCSELVLGRELLQDSLLELVCELAEIVMDVRRHGAQKSGIREERLGRYLGRGPPLATFD